MFNGRGFESLKNKSHDGGQNDELSYSVSSMQGWRNEMEDAHCAQIKNTVDKWAFFAVFDGHGGDQCSRECSGKRHVFTSEFHIFGLLYDCAIFSEWLTHVIIKTNS